MKTEFLLNEVIMSNEWFLKVSDNNKIGLMFTDLEAMLNQYVNKTFLKSSGYIR